ncbi:MAG: nucleotidyltransferase family protein [Candidatus Thermoplasmatota archaeon]
MKRKRMNDKNPITRKAEIINKLANNVGTIGKFGVRRIGLFGSVAKGEIKPGSDIDIIVEFEEGKENFKNLINLYFFLSDLLGSKIDLVTPESLSPYIAPYILKEVEYIEELSRIFKAHKRRM